ncbi:hypothetical protein [Paenibacillus nasutitermitis]|nr:hypothetical protein [Paenibacillus nasutitermitis]
MDDKFVWGIFVVDSSKPFPNFSPVGRKLVGMNGIHHEHFHFRDESSS